MYPNTIEPIRRRTSASKHTATKSSNKLWAWLSRYAFFFIWSILILTPLLMSASPAIDTTGLVKTVPDSHRTATFSDAQGFAPLPSATNTAEHHPLERLRITLWKNLLTDGLINDPDMTVILPFDAEVETLNGQPIPLSLRHKYEAIIYAYGVESGEGVEIRLSEDFIMVGTFDEQGILLAGKVRGVQEMAFTY